MTAVLSEPLLDSQVSVRGEPPTGFPVVVVQRYRSSPTRITTPSSKTIPSGRHITP